MSTKITSAAKHAETLAEQANILASQAENLANKLHEVAAEPIQQITTGVDPFIFAVTIFVLACFVGYYVVWKVTPALHTPLMAVTNAVSGIIIVGAIIALGTKEFGIAQVAGFIAVVLAAINIFGGFVVTYRMLAMFKKK